MIIRVTIANVTPRGLAKRLNHDGLPAVLLAGLGVAHPWGIEPTVTAEFAGVPEETVKRTIEAVLREGGETAAYVTRSDGTAWLWYATGDAQSIEGGNDARPGNDQGDEPTRVAP